MPESSAKLEPFLLMARATKGAAAAKIASDVIGANGVFFFNELLEMPNIKELKGNPSPALAASYALLELFAYKTYSDYHVSASSLPPLTAAQCYKLKQLSLVSCGMRSRSLTYPQLQTELQITSIRELEDFIIDSIYAGLIAGKLSQKDQGVFSVDSVIGRDISLSDGKTVEGLTDVELLKSRLENWCNLATDVITGIDNQISRTKEIARYEAAQNARYIESRDIACQKSYDDQTNPKKGKSKEFGDAPPYNPMGLGGSGGSGGFGSAIGGRAKDIMSGLGSKVTSRFGGGGGGGVEEDEEMEGVENFSSPAKGKGRKAAEQQSNGSAKRARS